MNNPAGKVNILLIIGICVIVAIVGFFAYQTILQYQEIIKEGEISPGESSQETATSTQEEGEEGEEAGEYTPQIFVSLALEKKSIVQIIAFKDFQDEEYFVPRNVFLAAGASVKTASNQTGTAVGADGGEVPVDFLVKDINPADFDAVVFIGGSGAMEYLDNEDSYNLAKKTLSQGKILAAICIGPAILAKAGVLEGKKATVSASPMDKSAVEILEDNGAVYQDEPVVVDGKIITGVGPVAANPFAMKIVEVLTNL